MTQGDVKPTPSAAWDVEPVVPIKAVNLRIKGGQRTRNPFTTWESLEKVAWDTQGGTQSKFQIRISRSKGTLLNDPIFDFVEETVNSWFLFADHPEVLDTLKEHPGRYYYTVRLFDEEQGWGRWSHVVKSSMSRAHYNPYCVDSFGYSLPSWVYPDWFYVNQGFTGYAWTRSYPETLGDWLLDHEPQPFPWGPAHHHM